ncbi:MAG: TolC family protein, partial [Pyrinomonadaceae bacterium]
PGTKTVRKPLAQTTKQETPPGQKKSSDPVSNPTAKGGSTTAPDITQNAEVSSAQNYPELGRIGVDTMKQFSLSMRDAIRMALTDNNDIAIARQNVRIAEFVLKGAYGAYDPLASAVSEYQRTINPVSSLIIAGADGTLTDKNFNNSATVKGLSPFLGGNYQLDFVANKTKTNNLFTSLIPQYPTQLTLTYTQPLWRGLLIDDSRRQIDISKKNLALSDAQFRQRAIEVIANVQQAYWDLVFALKNVQVQNDSLREAQSQLEHTRRMVAGGLSAPIDVVETETQVATFQQSLYTALNGVTSAENTLKNLVLRNQLSPLWSQAIQPTDPVDLKAPATTLDNAVATAYSNRPEVKQSDVNKELNEINKRYFRDQTRPQVNLTGTYGLIGLSGTASQTINPLTGSQDVVNERINLLSTLNGLTVLPPTTSSSGVPPILIGGVGQSFSNLFTNNFNTYTAGITFSLPIRNRTAKAQLGQALVEGEQIQTQREQLEDQIQVDVRNA